MKTNLAMEKEILSLHRSSSRRMIAFALLIMVAAVVFQLRSGNGTVTAQLGEEFLGVGGIEDSVFVFYTEITSVELTDALDRGSCLAGTDGTNVWNGRYQNQAYGSYRLYAYEKPGLYIVVRHTGGTLVFNCYTQNDTKEMYAALCEKLEAV